MYATLQCHIIRVFKGANKKKRKKRKETISQLEDFLTVSLSHILLL